MLIHSVERPHKCDTCGTQFALCGSLVKHNIRTHTGEEPYICDMCGAQFVQSVHMKRHIRTHTGQKP